jgi:hypothetical protein
MKRIMKVSGLAFLGVSFVLVGFLYDVLFAGIPYQDPTPELQSHWEFHKFVADVFYKTGGFVFLLGLLAAPMIWKMTSRKAQQSDAPAADG